MIATQGYLYFQQCSPHYIATLGYLYCQQCSPHDSYTGILILSAMQSSLYSYVHWDTYTASNAVLTIATHAGMPYMVSHASSLPCKLKPDLDHALSDNESNPLCKHFRSSNNCTC